MSTDRPSPTRDRAPARPVTLADVATASGVHPATVSRAISRPELVKAATVERVQHAIESLGYVPNRAARQLAGGATATIAVLVPDITNPFFSSIVQAAQRRAGAAGRLVLLADTAMNPDTEVDAVRNLAPMVDGLIVCSPTASPGALADVAAGRPIVFVNRSAPAVASVVVDQDAIIDLALDHLRSLGHRHIAVAAGPATYWSAARRNRRVGRVQTEATGITLLDTAEPSFEGGRQLLGPALATGATGIVAFNDVQALGLLAAAADRGIAVPADLSIVGIDGIPAGAMATPALTSVAVDLETIGHLAFDQLNACLAGDAATRHECPPTLVIRSSTGPTRERVGR